MRRIVAFGNCDAATALALQSGAGCGSLILTNPWIFDDADDDILPSPPAIRARYGAKLRRPAEWLRIVRGEVKFIKLYRGLRALFQERSQTGVSKEFARKIAAFDGQIKIILAERDRTAQAFSHRLERWRSAGQYPAWRRPRFLSPCRRRMAARSNISCASRTGSPASTWVDQRNCPTGRSSSSA